MDFWVVDFNDGGAIGVDNDGVQPVDLTPLPTNVSYFHWKKDCGEIHYNDRASLPERINDPTSYLWIIDQFIGLSQLNDLPINLNQAQTVKSETVDVIFHAKRQLPISYLGYQWNAMDDEVLAMNTGLTNGGFIGQSSQTDSLISQINTNIVSPINATFLTYINSCVGNLAYQINTNIVAQNDGTLVPRINAALTSNKTLANNILNERIGPSLTTSATGTINDANYHTGTSILNVNDASHPSATVSSSGSANVGFVDVPSTGVTAVGAGSSTGTIPWYPIGSATPVNLTVAQMSTLLANIVTRRVNIDQHRKSVQAAINACATIAQVIAIDLTTGWPTA